MSSNKTIRIRTTPGEDQNIQVKIEQDFDTIDILSLKITQEEAYKNFCSDYGVIVGRVIANDGFGVENAKISVFIPVSEEDLNNPNISVIYPYITPGSIDSQGYRYNLLPRDGKITKIYQSFPVNINPNNLPYSYNYSFPPSGSWIDPSWTFQFVDSNGRNVYSRQVDLGYGPRVPVGTFYSKQDILDNDVLLEVYEKYYKLTTKTNSSGDYMIFGVPVGNQVVHMDVDLSDAGQSSLSVEDFLNQGYPQDLFDGNNFKASSNLDSLPQIESRNISVEVVPFWGNPDQCEIGITRLDFSLNKSITPSALLIFQAFTNSEGYVMPNGIIGDGEFYGNGGSFGEITSMVTLPVSVAIKKTTTGEQKISNFSDGNVFMSIPMYGDRIVTDEFGNRVPSPDGVKGIPTSGTYDLFVWGTNTHAVGSDFRTNCTARFTNKSNGGGNGTILKFRYDLENKKRLIYTVGLKNNATDANNGDWRKCAIKSQGNNNILNYPQAYTIDSHSSFGNEETCYGSLYFLKFEDNQNNGYNDAHMDYDGLYGNEPYAGFKYKRLQLYGILDITDLIDDFIVFGGVLNTTSAFNGLYSTQSNFDGVDLYNNTISFSNIESGDVNYIGTEQELKRLNTITNTNLLNNSTYYNDIRGKTNPGGTIQNGRSYVGRYFYYFGLSESNNSLVNLKEKI